MTREETVAGSADALSCDLGTKLAGMRRYPGSPDVLGGDPYALGYRHAAHEIYEWLAEWHREHEGTGPCP